MFLSIPASVAKRGIDMVAYIFLSRRDATSNVISAIVVTIA